MLNVIYNSEYLDYNFGSGHPFSPDRWEALEDLLLQLSLNAKWVTPEAATDADILQIHDISFLEAVRSASEGFPGTHGSGFGLGTMDVPNFYGMHNAALAVCGGSKCAAIQVLNTSATKVLQLGGGFHHAMPAKAAGFCIYNDVALCIHTLRAHGKRVAFVDIDVHHGDGVQAMFYDDPGVLNISLHESGLFLFPGSGFVQEQGHAKGLGYTINIPLYPGTSDRGYLKTFDAIVPMALRSFNPDVIVIEAGADAHYADPMANLSLSTHGFQYLVSQLNRLSDELCGGRLISTLGGGYNFDSTLRLWAILAFTLAGQDVPEQLPTLWKESWEAKRGERLSELLHDQMTTIAPIARGPDQAPIAPDSGTGPIAPIAPKGPGEGLSKVAAIENEKTVNSLLDLLKTPF